MEYGADGAPGDVGGQRGFQLLRQAIADNASQPEGPARNARAEELVGEAERLGIPLAVIEALGHQVQMYNFSSEKDRMFVPFARLLRMWDERPEDFDEQEAHTLHWVFKWMSSGMLGQPHIALSAIEKWLGEMERRYRLAGHSERAVRSSEFSVARHVGDVPRAERAYAAWLAADRDSMADCHACELNEQGSWQVERGEDERALDLWAPVLRGEHTCAHEPHAVLASSLLPLVRLGRVDEARAHHLRGLRLVRAMESMRGAFAEHVEFCTLTGNEARALELLAERPAYFTDTGNPRGLMNHLGVTSLLMDRLTALGLGGQRVPGPAGREWTAAELAVHARETALSLAQRFDERNGTTRVSTELRRRMDAAPLRDRLPLGVRTVRPVAPQPAAVEAAAPSGDVAPRDVAALLSEARRLDEEVRPGTITAWTAVRDALRDDEAAREALTPADRATLADYAGMAPGTAPQDAVGQFERAAALYEEAGDVAEALAARARAALACALAGDVDAALERVGEPLRAVLALHGRGETGPRPPAAALASRMRIQMERLDATPDDDGPGAEGAAGALRAACTAVEDAARELLSFAGPHGSVRRLAVRAAEGHAALAGVALRRGDAAAAIAEYDAAAELVVTAGAPWFAAEYEDRVAGLARRLGDVETAERAARGALEHGTGYVTPAAQAHMHLQLAEVVGSRGGFEEASRHALEAAHWADEAGDAAGFGCWARYRLGGLLLRQGRAEEAAEVLESALRDLTVDEHGDSPVVQARWWLGDCLTRLGEHRAAAEQWLRAVELAEEWPVQQDHAQLAHLSASALERAGEPEQAARAFERAGELWQSLGETAGYVRTLRARAWLVARVEPDDDGTAAPAAADKGEDGGKALMAAAVAVCDEALAAVPDQEGDRRTETLTELGNTHEQFGRLIARFSAGLPGPDDPAATRAFEDALAHLGLAIAAYTEAGEDALHYRTDAELTAGDLELDLGRPEAARARARWVLAAYEPTGADGAADEDAPAPEDDPVVQQRRETARRLLSLATSEDAAAEGGEALEGA
ncbi:tetratricopeptide repeat protein [Streptomyces sp. NPDC050560]|uniref:tetratricopeptide repeat protein n=1 Tax=Streptomyces sp. NPDC050560 TaxID=3365630 RepID=UPI0037B871E5